MDKAKTTVIEVVGLQQFLRSPRQMPIIAVDLHTSLVNNVSSMNLEQSKLTVDGTVNSDGVILVERATCSQGR